MLDQSIRSWNPWWAQKIPPSLTGIRRDITEDIIKSLGTPHIKDIIGVRRCGKTTILYQVADHPDFPGSAGKGHHVSELG
ncbi:MAG: hypothetical protein WA130_07350 [Candidatus Methanoperedens sp.]